MLDVGFPAPAHRAAPTAQSEFFFNADRRLVMRPESFFSRRFGLAVEEDERVDFATPASARRATAVLLLLFGLPVLISAVARVAG
jgi:hypothetical protein